MHRVEKSRGELIPTLCNTPSRPLLLEKESTLDLVFVCFRWCVFVKWFWYLNHLSQLILLFVPEISSALPTPMPGNLILYNLNIVLNRNFHSFFNLFVVYFIMNALVERAFIEVLYKLQVKVEARLWLEVCIPSFFLVFICLNST